MRARYYIPLLGFVLPTVIIGYGIVIPRKGFEGETELFGLQGGQRNSKGS